MVICCIQPVVHGVTICGATVLLLLIVVGTLRVRFDVVTFVYLTLIGICCYCCAIGDSVHLRCRSVGIHHLPADYVLPVVVADYHRCLDDLVVACWWCCSHFRYRYDCRCCRAVIAVVVVVRCRAHDSFCRFDRCYDYACRGVVYRRFCLPCRRLVLLLLICSADRCWYCSLLIHRCSPVDCGDLLFRYCCSVTLFFVIVVVICCYVVRPFVVLALLRCCYVVVYVVGLRVLLLPCLLRCCFMLRLRCCSCSALPVVPLYLCWCVAGAVRLLIFVADRRCYVVDSALLFVVHVGVTLLLMRSLGAVVRCYVTFPFVADYRLIRCRFVTATVVRCTVTIVFVGFRFVIRRCDYDLFHFALRSAGTAFRLPMEEFALLPLGTFPFTFANGTYARLLTDYRYPVMLFVPLLFVACSLAPRCVLIYVTLRTFAHRAFCITTALFGCCPLPRHCSCCRFYCSDDSIVVTCYLFLLIPMVTEILLLTFLRCCCYVCCYDVVVVFHVPVVVCYTPY